MTKIRMRIGDVSFTLGPDNWLEMEGTALEVDGVPYASTVPQRWECEVLMCVGPSGIFSYPAEDSSEHRAFVKARFNVGFNASGRYWFSDAEAQRLAEALRADVLTGRAIRDSDMLLAATRLAGPDERGRGI